MVFNKKLKYLLILILYITTLILTEKSYNVTAKKRNFDRKNKIKWFNKCLNRFKSLDTKKRFSINDKDFYECLDDNTKETSFDSHYEYHQAWAARCVKKIKPKKRIDISSRITFNAVLSAFIPVDFYDYRPANLLNLSGLECKKADLTNLQFENGTIESLSCMHIVEHIGLGRYGDEIDPEGDLKAIKELKELLPLEEVFSL